MVVQRQSEFAGNPKMRSAATDRHHPAHLRPLFARIGMGFATFDAVQAIGQRAQPDAPLGIFEYRTCGACRISARCGVFPFAVAEVLEPMASDVGPQSSIAIAVKRVQEPIASTHTSGPGHQHETVLIVAPETNISWPPNGTDGITIGTVDIDDLRMRNHCVAADLQQRSGREAGSPDITALSRHQGEPGMSARYAHRYNIAMAETIDSPYRCQTKDCLRDPPGRQSANPN